MIDNNLGLTKKTIEVIVKRADLKEV